MNFLVEGGGKLWELCFCAGTDPADSVDESDSESTFVLAIGLRGVCRIEEQDAIRLIERTKRDGDQTWKGTKATGASSLLLDCGRPA